MSSPTDVRRDSIQPRDLIKCLTKEPLHYAIYASPAMGLRCLILGPEPWMLRCPHFLEISGNTWIFAKIWPKTSILGVF